MVGGRRPGKDPVEGGTGGAPAQVDATTTRAVATDGTVEVRTRAPVNPPAKEPQRKPTRLVRDVSAVPATRSASVVPTSRNYYESLQKHPTEEDERQSHEKASTSSDVFPKVTGGNEE